MPVEPDPIPPFEVIPDEAAYWWRTTQVSGAILHRLMILFILVPMVLVYYRYYVSSFLVFALIVPYGLFLRYLSELSVTRIIRKNPETLEHFEQEGVILR
jgi:hypothetical protein